MTQAAVKQLIRSDGIKNTSLFKQTWAMSAVLLDILSVGIMQHPLTAEELYSAASPILAYNSMATVIGYVASSVLMDQVGRRLTFILGTLLGILSCFLLYYPRITWANTLRMTFDGLSNGFTVILGTVVIGEYTSPKYRGVFLNLITTSMTIGSTIGLMLRPNYHWQLILIALFLKMISFGIGFTWPESPYWLISKSIKREKAFQKLSGTTCEKETADLIARRNRTKNGDLFKMTVGQFKKYLSSAFLRPLTVVVFGILVMESSGKHLLPALSIKTVQTIGIYYQIVILLSSIATLSLVVLVRHRTQLLITGCLAASTLFLTSAYVFLISNNFITNNIPWLGSLLFILQLVFLNLGSTSIPLALIGEVFPMDCKAVGTLLSGVLISVTSSAVLRSIPYLLLVLHLEGLLILFGALLTVSLLVLYFILPETKHKTLLEIEEYFNSECTEDIDGLRYKSLYNSSFMTSIL